MWIHLKLWVSDVKPRHDGLFCNGDRECLLQHSLPPLLIFTLQWACLKSANRLKPFALICSCWCSTSRFESASSCAYHLTVSPVHSKSTWSDHAGIYWDHHSQSNYVCKQNLCGISFLRGIETHKIMVFLNQCRCSRWDGMWVTKLDIAATA